MRWIPLVAVGVTLVLVAPVWPWSRGWSWVPTGMVAVTLGTIALFSLAVIPA